MASKDSPCASRDFPEIARIILEERDKGPKDWERNKWAKANKHLVCATCKENNVECIPLDSRIYCNSLVCKKSDRLCSKFNDELYDRIAKRVPTLERTAFDDVMSPQRTTEYTGLSFKIPARRPSSTSPAKRTQNSTSSDESQSVSTKTGDIHPNSGIQTLSQKFADKSRENDELQVELKKLKADSEKQKVETEAEIQKLKADLDTTKAALIAANERAEQEENLRREMMQNITPQEQIDALKKDLEDSRRQLLVKQQIQDQLKNKIQSLQRESSRTTIPIEKHRSKVNGITLSCSPI
ncbi:uncharacterized protein EV420DRAFT_146913 [Desarmillaria tabescens]|uniref:Uncharacterized protein n=1 Tax=Armillaria tabescens TaxID=1929756 RepID=A0AA39NAK2_ARMTA|nr:uncharacterized protein EV420DRAFT_146913 [Desarmillaria tabescens]KAK0462080.1 hypothetical protein EV420DRAFT_146913 [Desarmillaria tabescens]